MGNRQQQHCAAAPSTMPKKKKGGVDLTMTPEMEAYAEEVKEQLDKLKNEKIQMKVERTAEKGKCHLSLQNKRLNTVPEEIAEWAMLKHFDARCNQIGMFPPV